MDATTWAAVAATASAASAFLSFCSLAFTGRTALIQAKVAEFNNCIEIVAQLGAAQRKVSEYDPGTREHNFEFRELLNLLETLALLVNRRKITQAARDYTTKFLIQALAWIDIDETMKKLIAESITGIDTFADLNSFRQRRRQEIEHQTDIYAQREIN
jgi:hypothetical protein